VAGSILEKAFYQAIHAQQVCLVDNFGDSLPENVPSALLGERSYQQHQADDWPWQPYRN
jgi:hypothetical protein